MLDLGMVCRYVATFGSFLLALLISLAVTDYFYFDHVNDYYLIVYSSYIIVEACNFASQSLLAFLLLSLTKEENDVVETEVVETEEMEFAEVSVVEFDEHAELQSKMWN